MNQLLQTNRPVQTDSLLQTWSQLSRITGSFLRPGGLAVTNTALQYCQFSQEAILLDVGCGLGGTLQRIHELGYACMGLDVSMDLLTQGQIGGGDVAPLLVQADISHMPLQTASVQGIFCECVLSLCAKPHAILQDFHRILQTKGRLIITDIVRKKESTNSKKQDSIHIGQSCLHGALPRALLKTMLFEAGFALRFEQDCSRHLAELAALLVLHDRQGEAFFSCSESACACERRHDFGYVLLVAEKM